jgi:hypothetical protein
MMMEAIQVAESGCKEKEQKHRAEIRIGTGYWKAKK